MPSERFIMDNGGGYETDLWRHEIIRQHWKKFVWRDAPPGERHEIQVDDIDGHPVDRFGLPLRGKFVALSNKVT